MYLELSCPLELIEHELSRDDMGKVRAYISLYNLSDRPIVRIEGAVHWTNSKTGQRKVAPFIADRLVTESQRPFKIQVSSGDCPGADGLEVTFDRLRFAGGAEWTGDEGRRVRIEAPLAPRGSELNRLMAAAGADARNFPVHTSGYWICVCGRPNEAEAAGCARCGRERDAVLSQFTRSKVLSGETPAVHEPVAKAEIPRFLTDEPDRDDARAVAMHVLRGLQADYKRQRNTLIRRSIFLAVAIIAALALIYSMRWLGEQSEIAKDVRPAVKVEETVAT